VRPPNQNRSRSRNRFPAGYKPSQHGGAGRVDSGRGRGGSESAMAKHTRYLELARQARTAGDEVAMQHNFQQAEHWYRTAMADRRTGDDPRVELEGEVLAD
jgi:hypothetical protein